MYCILVSTRPDIVSASSIHNIQDSREGRNTRRRCMSPGHPIIVHQKSTQYPVVDLSTHSPYITLGTAPDGVNGFVSSELSDGGSSCSARPLNTVVMPETIPYIWRIACCAPYIL